eukprot:comp54452_c0_seq1/m.47760 comp54452_c0_seq1/g.47760  ORF comp54452_c0_seq1/g.47760 comp54452_c0_seq1/m.47760 type:complete len:194 (-) comp54452_c0_seq1:391-972(-)
MSLAMSGTIAARMCLPRALAQTLKPPPFCLLSRAHSTTRTKRIGLVGLKRSVQQHAKDSVTETDDINTPSEPFDAVLRKFWFKVHPDLLGRHPDKRSLNEKSLAELNAFVHELEHTKRQRGEGTAPFPRAQKLNLEFSVAKDALRGEDREFRNVRLQLKTSGGDCRRAVGEAFSALFSSVDLPSKFHWGDKYW